MVIADAEIGVLMDDFDCDGIDEGKDPRDEIKIDALEVIDEESVRLLVVGSLAPEALFCYGSLAEGGFDGSSSSSSDSFFLTSSAS